MSAFRRALTASLALLAIAVAAPAAMPPWLEAPSSLPPVSDPGGWYRDPAGRFGLLDSGGYGDTGGFGEPATACLPRRDPIEAATDGDTGDPPAGRMARPIDWCALAPYRPHYQPQRAWPAPWRW